ncbi:MAG: phospholipid carrier-dependent glycosyltransferase [Gemmatimonadetes bacterium]|nr:phospholipid carrier-dependent glycosyltransferase [Gemmatimonadota bacterium]
MASRAAIAPAARAAITPAVTAVLLAIILCVAGAFAWITVGAKGATVDETHYIGLGRDLAQRGDWTVPGAILHPPLSYYLNSLLLPGFEWTDADRALHQDERGRRLIARGEGTSILLRARLPFVLVHLLGALVVFAAGRRWFGNGAGLAAALLFAFEPTVLAHSSVATQDALLAVLFFASVVLTEQWVRGGGRWHLLSAGGATGFALLAKFPAMLLFAILPALVLLSLGPGAHGVRRAGLLRLIASLAIGFAVLHIGYAPHYLAGGEALFGLPAPFVEGIRFQLSANEGHQAFFMGEVASGGWFAYYPVALAVKTSFALLAAVLVGAVVRARALRREPRARAYAELWLWLPPIAFLLFFVFVSRLAIGVRYVLPVYPFLAILGGAGIASVLAHRSILQRSLAVVLLLLAPLVSFQACPDYLAYFNEPAGGAEGGRGILGDSNLDWGQDLPGLAHWMKETGVPTLYLAYFGNDAPEHYGIRYHYVPGWLYAPRGDFAAGRDRPADGRDFIAIGRSVLQGFWLPEPDLFHWLYEYERVAVIGGTLEVYDLAGSAAAHEQLAKIYERAGQFRLAALERGQERGPARNQDQGREREQEQEPQR